MLRRDAVSSMLMAVMDTVEVFPVGCPFPPSHPQYTQWSAEALEGGPVGGVERPRLLQGKPGYSSGLPRKVFPPVAKPGLEI
jgi:hypothetical protein